MNNVSKRVMSSLEKKYRMDTTSSERYLSDIVTLFVIHYTHSVK